MGVNVAYKKWFGNFVTLQQFPPNKENLVVMPNYTTWTTST
jgi:hypothetical protein